MDEAYETESMIEAGVIGVGFGAYLGLLFYARKFPGLQKREVDSDARWYTWPLLRVLVGFIICLPVGSFYLLKH